MDASTIGESAGAAAWTPVLDFLTGLFSEMQGAGMPGDLISIFIGFIGSFAVLWALWYGFKALRKAFSKANF